MVCEERSHHDLTVPCVTTPDEVRLHNGIVKHMKAAWCPAVGGSSLQSEMKMEMTAEEGLRARKEGWDYNMYVFPVANECGVVVFQTVGEVMDFIYKQAVNGSKWHEKIFLALPWTLYDQLKLMDNGYTLTKQFGLRQVVDPHAEVDIDGFTQRAQTEFLFTKALRQLALIKLRGES